VKKRLQVVLAHAGVTSRRKARAIIEAGRVTVNGQIVREKGLNVDPELEEIRLDGKALSARKKVYYLLNKPKGVITTVSDDLGRGTVLDLIKTAKDRIYPVGRLDKETEGILLLTNDGEMAYKLTHPKFGVKKVYIAEIKGRLKEDDLKKMEQGIYIDGKKTSPCSISMLRNIAGKAVLRITLHEGRKRQVRRMVESMGSKVTDLKRVEYAGIRLADLSPGMYRKLSSGEIAKLKRC